MTAPEKTQGEGPPEPAPLPPTGWRARAGAARDAGEGLLFQLEENRPRHVSVDVGFRFLERDKQIAGGVLGGGLAYRFFFWILAYSLLLSGGLGFAASWGEHLDTAVHEAGLTEAVAGTVDEAAQQAEAGRWWLLLLGLYFVLWFSWSLLRALRLVHAAAWRIRPSAATRVPQAIGLVIAAPFILSLTAAGAGWVRENTGFLPGLVATLAWTGVIGGLWLLASMRLPRRDAHWTALLPGAVLVAVGVDALHLFTVYFLANKLASSSALYGALGVAATMLFFLFLVGRMAVWAAELNAVVWESRDASARS